MYDAPGIGLAAIQVGVAAAAWSPWTCRRRTRTARQAAGLHQSGDHLASSDEKSVYEEGCLSIPEYYEEVERPAEVKVKYLDLDGKAHEIDAEGLFATCIQHEIDHINGVLFIDHISKLKRDRVDQEIHQGRQGARRQRSPGGGLLPLRLVFMGTPDFAVPTLLELVGAGQRSRRSIPARAKPAGRGMELRPSPVEREARRFGLPVITPKTLKTPEALAEFARPDADAAVVVAYGMILPQGDTGCPEARLLQPARLPAAALARRRADQPRHHGRRRARPA